ncbi:peptide chain release factor [Cyclospora cayetanensis]|uniref:Peptide chain release factor n=1 Tax=Cyclospora cayetanensis TaxID=88456 RepID=A0A1D3D3H8_9EIME|nr:peptide chain release factor [Cyclospora cayetanensis]
MAICCRSVSRLALRIQPFCAARSDTAPWTPSRCIPSRSAAHNRRSSAERLLPQRQQHCCSSIRWTGSFAAHVASQHREYLVAKETAWCWKKSHTATASAARFTTSTVSAKAGRELLLDEPQRLVLEREGAVVAEISDLLLQHAEVLAAVAEGRTSARNKHKRSEASTDEAMLEVLAGVGGEEAAQFASELFGMYGALAERQGWRFDVLERNKSAEGCGLKNAKALVSGHGVGVLLVLEAGVHRVQRVPSTDAKRRLQTSTAAVTVLPCVSEVEVDMSPSSLRIESMRASGPGGQSVNKSETAVRVTHLPTGLSVCMKDTSSQMGGKYRSEKIRTYNFPSDCVRDHRISQHVANVREFLGSADGLPQLLNELYMQHQKVVLNETLQAIQSIVEQR